MNYSLKILSVFAALLLFASPSDAQIIELTAPTLPGGNKNITYDQSTGLEWLDWSATTNLTYSYVNSQTWPDGTFQGFRLATRSEVRLLLENLGMNVNGWPSGTFESDNGLSAAIALNVLGQAHPNLQTPLIAAVTSDNDSNCDKMVVTVGVYGQCFHSLVQANTIQHPMVSNAYAGFALVRQSSVKSVNAEPSTQCPQQLARRTTESQFCPRRPLRRLFRNFN